jgi:hypothetical protein
VRGRTTNRRRSGTALTRRKDSGHNPSIRRVDLYWLAFPADPLEDVRRALAQHDVQAEEVRRRVEEGGDVVTLEVWGLTVAFWWWERRRFEQLLRAIAYSHGATLMRQRLRLIYEPWGSWYAPRPDE